ncbi:MAG: hypothetical protein HY720_19340 [Planctomycetes bacterium]|nr:hypothetical protein [Planctomycetota bacterium]
MRSTFGDEPTYDSPEEAVSAAARDPRTRRADDDTAVVRGSTVEGAGWNETSFWVTLSGGHSLLVEASGGIISWTVDRVVLVSPIETSDCDPLVLQLVGDDSSSIEIPWDRHRLATDRIGRKIDLLSTSTTCFWLYCAGVRPLMFSRLIEIPSGRTLLDWAESD